MKTAKFLETVRWKVEDGPSGAPKIISELLVLLDEYEGEKCSVLAGKIRAQLEIEEVNMLFKIEIIESQEGDEFIYKNPYHSVPYRRTEVLLAASLEEVKSDKTAIVVGHAESMTFKAKPGLVIYGRTRLVK